MRKKTKENPPQIFFVLHLCNHFKWLQCYCALDVRRGPNENIELFLLLLLFFFALSQPGDRNASSVFTWTTFILEMENLAARNFFLLLFKTTISYFLL